ncbi:lysosomal membrane ascorbate-dependent ferrireductase CYB561A3-like [Synchiropus splendidus]|uniref:lysosomal membrane ascorbate-dependent ferrireductase CYB561A3-like n=1 Tax=Synchiropus splendidus TaxID=270530 RepID=UPI00237DE839|nr:lysosomal membrane ascorbate-dependent ferrireductase CYB561A3-like [Synchiropus splendidus]
MLVVFYLLYTLSLCLGLLSVLLVGCWMSRWQGGFSWTGSPLQFNWHPVLMVSGLVVLSGLAAVIYRTPFTWTQRKLTWKLVHAGLMLLALVFSSLGLQAVFSFKQLLRLPHLQSLHSWVGFCTVLLFALQWVLGGAGFLLTWTPLWIRQGLKPLHVWTGKVVLILSLIACISGINEKLLLSANTRNSTAEQMLSYPAQVRFGNSIGFMIIAFGLVILGILSRDKWKRPEPSDEGEHLFILENGG